MYCDANYDWANSYEVLLLFEIYFQKLKVFEHVIVDVEIVTVMNNVGEKK